MHSTMNGWIFGFLPLFDMNKATMNIHTQYSVWTCFHFLGFHYLVESWLIHPPHAEILMHIFNKELFWVLITVTPSLG